MRNVIRSSLPQEIKDSLNVCWKEGVVAQVMISIFDYYLVPYGLFLGATTQEIGFLVAVPMLLSSLSQFLAVSAVHITGSRRSVLLYGIGTQAVLLVPVAFLPFVPIPHKIVALVVLIAIYRGLGSVIGPAWGSLVSDYLPTGQRGQYFGWRQRMVSLAGIVGIGFWGGILFLVRKVAPQNVGFLILFSGAVLFRWISFYFTTRMSDISLVHTEESQFSFFTFLRSFRHSNTTRFIFYVTTMTFAVQLAQPFYAVQILKNLHFNYLSYTVIYMAATVTGMISFPLWGKQADIVGNAQVLKSTGLLLPLLPFFVMFARTPLEFMLIEGLSGFLFAGFSLGTTNFIYDNVPAAQRVRYIGYYNVVNSAFVFAGTTLGGYLGERLPPLLGYRLVSLFLLSVVLRILVQFTLSPHFGEVRMTKRVSSSQLYLSVLGVRPITGEVTEPEVYPEIRPPREQFKHGVEQGTALTRRS